MINLSTFDASLRSRLLGWCCSLALILGVTAIAFAPSHSNLYRGFRKYFDRTIWTTKSYSEF